jgi:hypothetical protein
MTTFQNQPVMTANQPVYRKDVQSIEDVQLIEGVLVKAKGCFAECEVANASNLKLTRRYKWCWYW